MFTNWMTTVGGIIAGLPAAWALVQTVVSYKYTGDVKTDFLSVGALVVGLLAKDFNVTGGMKPQ